jgi:hypothetical protein
MNLRTCVLGMVAACVAIAILSPPELSSADPILKPRKYTGPIPKRYFSFSIGVLGGAENQDMWGFLERQIDEPLKDQIDSSDFGASLSLDACYAVKVHPQFAVRTRAGLSILGADMKGLFVPNVEPDTTGARPLLRFDRAFDVLLFSIDASGLFFFQDASVKEFQTYFGGGFSFFIPYAKYTEDLVNEETGEPYGNSETSKWSLEPGVHAVLGFIYHFKPTLAFNMEGRVQISQSKFELDYLTTEGLQNLSFDVDYTGFIISAGVAKFF